MWGGVCVWQPRAWGTRLDCHLLRGSCLFQVTEQEWAAVYNYSFHFKWRLTSGLGGLMQGTPTHKYTQTHLLLSSPLCTALSFWLPLGLPQVSGQNALLGLNFKSFQIKSHMRVFKRKEEFFSYFTFLFGAVAFRSRKRISPFLCYLSKNHSPLEWDLSAEAPNSRWSSDALTLLSSPSTSPSSIFSSVKWDHTRYVLCMVHQVNKVLYTYNIITYSSGITFWIFV